MVHHQCADVEPQADDTEAQKKHAARAETGRRASIKPKEPRANTPKKPAGERRDPIEAALHRVEMEFKLKAMQEQKQHDQREKNDQKANAEVDQLLRRRQSMRIPKPKCQVAGDPNTIRETTEDDKQVMAEARKNNMHVKLKTLMERPDIADKQLDAIVIFKALQDANGSVVAAKRTLVDGAAQAGANSPEKHKDQAAWKKRGLEALQTAKTLFGEYVAESQQCDTQNRGVKREHSEAEAMLRDHKSIRLSTPATKRRLAFDEDFEVATCGHIVEEEAMFFGIEVATPAAPMLEEAVASPLQGGEETPEERRRRGEAALQKARVLSKELEDERKQAEKRQRIEENQKREELKAGLADMLKKKAVPGLSMTKAFKTKRTSLNNDDASRVQADISMCLSGVEDDAGEAATAPAAAVPSIVVQADSNDIDQNSLPAATMVERTVAETRASDVANVAAKRRSGEGVRRRRSGEQAERMANLLCQELAEERQQHDEQKKGSGRVEKVRRKHKATLRPRAAKVRKHHQAFSDDDDEPILGQDELSADSKGLRAGDVVSVVADDITKTELTRKVSLGSTPPAKTTLAPQYSERASPKFRSPEDLFFAIVANGSPSRA